MTFRLFVSVLMSYCLGMAPANARVMAQQEPLRQFLKDSALGQNMTIAEWFKKNQAYMHPKVKELAMQWSLKHPNVRMPKVKMTSFKTEGAQDTTRLVFEQKRKSKTVDVISQANSAYFKINGKKYTYNDIYYDGYMERAVNSPQLTPYELKKFYSVSKKSGATYQKNLRSLVNAITTLKQGLYQNKSQKTSLLEFVIPTAIAANEGQSCIMAGYVTSMKKDSCGGDGNFQEGCTQTAGQTPMVSCNPLVYGKAYGGALYCVPRAPAVDVSVSCDKLYPIPGVDKASGRKTEEMLIESIIGPNAKPGGQSGLWDGFFKDLEGEIQNASNVCVGPDFNFEAHKAEVKAHGPGKLFSENDQRILNNFPVENRNGKDQNLHHRIACATVMNRLFYLESSRDCATDTLSQGQAVGVNCQAAEEKIPVPKAKPDLGSKTDDDDDMSWLWILLGVVAVGCIFVCFGGDDKKPPVIPDPPIPIDPPVGKPGESGIDRTMPAAVTTPTGTSSVTPTSDTPSADASTNQ